MINNKSHTSSLFVLPKSAAFAFLLFFSMQSLLSPISGLGSNTGSGSGSSGSTSGTGSSGSTTGK